MRDGKKIKNNLMMGIFSQAIILIFGLVVPRLVLTEYGSEVNGLLSSVTNIYSYLALVQAGVSTAACQALYKPIAENNQACVNSVLSATDKYYRRTGVIYLALIGAFSAIYPVVIQSNIPYTTIVMIILLNGIGNVVNYFFHGKYLLLLKADGKSYVHTGMDSFTNVLKESSKIILISLGYNVVFVQLVAMLASFAQMIYITYYIKKNYSWIDLSAEPDMAAISKSKYAVALEVNNLVTNNVDTVLLTLFSSLKKVSVYTLYNGMLFGMINRVLRAVRDGLEFKVAHIYHQDKVKFQQWFRAFESYYIAVAFSLFSITLYFSLPFVGLYTKGITDVDYLDPILPLLFVFINLLTAGRYPSDAMIHITGRFKETQTSAIVESLINVVISLILVQFMGIAGVLLGTIVSSLYRTNYLILYVNKKIIERSPMETYWCWSANLGVFLVTAYVSRYLVVTYDSYIKMFICCIPYAVCVLTLHIACTSICFPKAMKNAVAVGKELFGKKQ